MPGAVMQGRDMHSVQTRDVFQLDGLLEELGKEGGVQCEALREHLESARIYLMGLMPAEYALSLQLAGEALSCVSNVDLRARIEEFIHGTEGRQHAGKKDSTTSPNRRAPG